MSEATFTTRALDLERGGRTVLRSIDLELTPGEVVAVVGTNGGSRSSLRGVLAGDLRPTAGDPLVDGTDLGSWSAVAVAGERAGLLQQPSVRFPLRAEEVVAL